MSILISFHLIFPVFPEVTGSGIFFIPVPFLRARKNASRINRSDNSRTLILCKKCGDKLSSALKKKTNICNTEWLI
jgi:hypothetical protein